MSPRAMLSDLASLQRRSEAASVLIVTNNWPVADREHSYGPFIRRQVDSVMANGVECDVLLIRGYRGAIAYAVAAARLLGWSLRGRGRYRLVHAHSGEAAVSALFYRRAPLLISYLGSDILGQYLADGSLGPRKRLRRIVLRQAARFAAATITKSQQMEDVLPRSVRSRNTVLPNGVNRELFRPLAREAARAELGWEPDERVVLFASDPGKPNKRFGLAQSACAAAARGLDGVRLHLAWNEEADRMPLLMSAADCLLQTSISEGSPNIVKEALACNLPVIATGAGDIPELIAGVEACAIAEATPEALGDALVRCLREPRRSNGRDRSEHLDQGVIAERLVALYRGLMRPGEPRRRDRRRDRRRGRGRGGILMLVENAPYPQDIRVYHEAESLAAAGQRVTVLAPRASGQPTREVINGVIVRRFDLPWAATRAAWTYLLEYVVAHAQLLRLTAIELVRGARVVHFHGPPDTLFVAGLLARLARRKVIFDFHDSAPELFRAKFGSTRAIGLLVRAQRYAAMCADHVIVTNETQRDIVHALVDRPQEEVSVIRNGPRASDFHGEFERGSTNGHPVHGRDVAPEGWSLAYLGVLDVQDGVLELVDLLQAPELSAAHLTVIGSGPLRAEFQERVRRAGLQERVTLTGFVPHAHVPALLARCDIGLDLAPGTELNHGSTMVKVVEYLAAGVPVVSFDLLETRRTAGDAALYAPPGDLAAFAGLVARLARDPALRAELSRRGLERALAGLMWEHSEEELLRVYSRLLNGGVDEFPVPALADQQGPKLG